MMNKQVLDAVCTLAAGGLFAAGLMVSGMARPETVLDFLTFRDLGLLLVLGAAVAINLLVFQLWPRWRAQPWLGGSYQQRPFVLTRRTLAGGVLFGIGWGLCGVCPAPALAGLGGGDGALGLALLGMLAGGGLHGWWASRAT